MNDAANNQSQIYMKSASWGRQIDPAEYRSPSGFGREGVTGAQAVFESRKAVVSGAAQMIAGSAGSAGNAGNAGNAGSASVAAIRAASLRALVSDEEFYEVFAEIRLP